jgi:hypothetical protein
MVLIRNVRKWWKKIKIKKKDEKDEKNPEYREE